MENYLFPYCVVKNNIKNNLISYKMHFLVMTCFSEDNKTNSNLFLFLILSYQHPVCVYMYIETAVDKDVITVFYRCTYL